MKVIRKRGWEIDKDGVPFIYKDPDSKTYYTIEIDFKGTSISTGPTWTSDGVTITNESSSVSSGVLSLSFKVANTGEATVTFTDDLGNEEALTFRWKCRDR